MWQVAAVVYHIIIAPKNKMSGGRSAVLSGRRARSFSGAEIGCEERQTIRSGSGGERDIRTCRCRFHYLFRRTLERENHNNKHLTCTRNQS
jgi:hypothetical protein